MNRLVYIFSIILVLSFISCASKHDKTVNRIGKNVTLSYAKGFEIADADSFTIITVKNPWKENTNYARYYLIKETDVVTPTDGVRIKIPITSLMVNSATLLGFIDILNELDKVTGVCNSHYIYNPYILESIKSDKILDLGEAFNLDIERLMLLQPQAVMTTAYNTDDENAKRLKQSGINIIYNIEWQEPSILGRAEWIKFIGAFFDKQVMADSIFNEIASNYNATKDEVKRANVDAPTIFSGQDYRGTWSMAGGKSYTAQLFKDANATYQFMNDTTTASISATTEDALLRFADTEIWIGTQENTLEELGLRDNRYKLFNAYKTGKVFNNNKRINHKGGNDYWESGVVRPDLLLKDMIKICHPSLLPDYETTYMDQLK